MIVETIAVMRGRQIVTAWCDPCDRKERLDLDRLPGELPYHELRGRLRCRDCGNTDIEIRASWCGLIALGLE